MSLHGTAPATCPSPHARHTPLTRRYRLLHRDIKPKNLGLMHDGRLVVFDFGISKLLRRDEDLPVGEPTPAVKMTEVVGSLRYMAPEVAMSRPYNHKSEMYSFAIVLWEMVALRRTHHPLGPSHAVPI